MGIIEKITARPAKTAQKHPNRAFSPGQTYRIKNQTTTSRKFIIQTTMFEFTDFFNANILFEMIICVSGFRFFDS